MGGRFDFLCDDEDFFNIAAEANRVKNRSDYARRPSDVDGRKSKRSSSNSNQIRRVTGLNLARITELASPSTIPESSPLPSLKN